MEPSQLEGLKQIKERIEKEKLGLYSNFKTQKDLEKQITQGLKVLVEEYGFFKGDRPANDEMPLEEQEPQAAPKSELPKEEYALLDIPEDAAILFMFLYKREGKGDYISNKEARILYNRGILMKDENRMQIYGADTRLFFYFISDKFSNYEYYDSLEKKWGPIPPYITLESFR